MTRAGALGCALAFLSVTLFGQDPAGDAAPPANDGARLVVLLVVDQLSAGVLKAAWPHLGPGGFKRLERTGTSYPLAAYPYANTETAPGHASLATGTTPSVHGIVGNDWIDPATGGLVGSVDDPKSPLTSRATCGASARQLEAPTLGDALELAYGPKSRVASVAVKDRSAILLAGRGGDCVAWLDKGPGAFTTSAAFAASGDLPWLDAINRIAPFDAVSSFAWERTGPAEAYADLGPDDEPAEFPLAGSRTLPRTLRRAETFAAAEFHEWLVYSPATLPTTFAAARILIEHARLGQDDVPDFLGVSVSATDYVGHIFGPDSHEVRDMTLRTDALIADFLKHLDATVGSGRWILMLSADHGIPPIPEVAVRRGLPAGRVNRSRLAVAIEGALRERFGEPPAGLRYVVRMHDAALLLNRPLLEELGIPRAKAQAVAAAAAATVPGIARAFSADALVGAPRADAVEEAFRLGIPPARAADVYVLQKPYHLFSGIASHGTPYEYDQRVPLFLAGPGIRVGHTSTVAAAPGSGVVTIAAALGIAPPARATHPPLRDALAN